MYIQQQAAIKIYFKNSLHALYPQMVLTFWMYNVV